MRLGAGEFLVGSKSHLPPTQAIPWMGKDVDLEHGRISQRRACLVDIVARWLSLALRRYTRRPLLCLLGRIGWLSRPAINPGGFLSGVRAWLLWGPPTARRALPAVL